MYFQRPSRMRAQVAPPEVDQRHQRLGKRRLVVHGLAAKRRRQRSPGDVRRLSAPGPGVPERLASCPRRAHDVSLVHRAQCPGPASGAARAAWSRRRKSRAPLSSCSSRPSPWSDVTTRSVSSRMPRRRQGGVEAADQVVGPRHFPVVGPVGVARGVRLRRLVGIVRIVEVHPGEAPLVDRTRASHRSPQPSCRRPASGSCSESAHRPRRCRTCPSSGRTRDSAPTGRDSTIDETKPAVRKPCCFRISARIGTFVASGGETLSRMPCSAG